MRARWRSDKDFTIVGGDDLVAQTKAAMENVGIALKAAGAEWGDVVAPDDLHALPDAVRGDRRRDRRRSRARASIRAQTILGVTALAVPGLLIEIEVTALVD